MRFPWRAAAVSAALVTAAAGGSVFGLMTAPASASSSPSPIVTCVNTGARSYNYVPWRGVWETYTANPSHKCPSGSFKANIASEKQLNKTNSAVAGNASAIAGNSAAISSNTSAISTNATGVAANKKHATANTQAIAGDTVKINANTANVGTNSAALSALAKPEVSSLVTTPEPIRTGGSFIKRATNVGTLTLPKGTYLVSVSFKATPDAVIPAAVFPQMMVYNGLAQANFSNNLFNLGAGALEQATSSELSAGDLVDSYYSGQDVVTVTVPTETLWFYAFGYDSDTGSGSYALDSVVVTAVNLGG